MLNLLNIPPAAARRASQALLVSYLSIPCLHLLFIIIYRCPYTYNNITFASKYDNIGIDSIDHIL